MINIDSRILDKELINYSEFWLLIHIVKRINKDLKSFPGNETLCKDTGYARKKVFALKAKLIEKGLIQVLHRKGKDGKFSSNEYILTTDLISVFIPSKKGEALATDEIDAETVPPDLTQANDSLSLNGALNGVAVSPKKEKNNFAVSPNGIQNDITVSPKRDNNGVSMSPNEVQSYDTVSPNEVQNAFAVSPKTGQNDITVSPNQVQNGVTVSPNEVMDDGAVSPNMVDGEGFTVSPKRTHKVLVPDTSIIEVLVPVCISREENFSETHTPKKNENFDSFKDAAFSPPPSSAAPPPETATLFRETKYVPDGFSLFEADMIARNGDYAGVDLEYYYHKVLNWSDEGNRRKNWLASAGTFILNDRKENKLQIKKYGQQNSIPEDATINGYSARRALDYYERIMRKNRR